MGLNIFKKFKANTGQFEGVDFMKNKHKYKIGQKVNIIFKDYNFKLKKFNQNQYRAIVLKRLKLNLTSNYYKVKIPKLNKREFSIREEQIKKIIGNNIKKL